MDNSFFVFSEEIENLILHRFHVCSWEFRDSTGLTEFGIEINQEQVKNRESLILNLYIPWLDSECIIEDYYTKLMDLQNLKFIFNEIPTGHKVFDEDGGKTGCVQEFKDCDSLCLFPVTCTISDKVLKIKLDLKDYKKNRSIAGDSNLYLRIALSNKNKASIRLQKAGLNKSTIIYDIKINEKRNLPAIIKVKYPCKISTAFYFNIVPNNFELVFYDNKTLQNVRNLEYSGFKKYLNDKRVRENDLVVIKCKEKGKDSYSFFNYFTNEVIGVGVLAIGFLLELVCGILLFLPSLENDGIDHNLWNLPWELYTACSISFLMIVYFFLKKFRPNILPW